VRSDLDRLMEERGLDVAIVSGRTYGNPSLVYMLGGADVSQGILIKRRGEEPLLVHSPIERDEAKASGLRLVDMNQYDVLTIMRESASPLDGKVELYRRLFADLGVRGEVGFYGVDDPGHTYVFLKALDERLPDVHVRGEFDQGLFDVARATKSADEVARIREAGRLTTEVIAGTVDFMRQHRVEQETLLQADGSPLTIGVVKQHILRLLAERRLEDTEGVIFAIGADAGVPHSKGRPDDPIRLGQTIVYDLFPRLAGGYYFDCTRTYCLGYAPPEVERVYQHVRESLEAVIAASEVGLETKKLQQLTCEFFEQRGYVTVASDSQTQVGYIHSIGHGLGLAVHEEPFFSDTPSNTRTVQPGQVFTVEPGLYYPERGYGVRLEDVVWVDDQGEVHNLTALPYELVVEMS
jgi:Xaa-Pro aminopeptidase